MLCVVPSVCGTSPSLHASLPPLLQPHWLFAVSGTYQRVFRLRDLYILFFLLKFSSLVYLFVFLVFCSNLTLSMRLALSTLYNTAAWTHLPHPVLFLLRNTYHILTYFIILPFFFFFWGCLLLVSLARIISSKQRPLFYILIDGRCLESVWNAQHLMNWIRQVGSIMVGSEIKEIVMALDQFDIRE